MNSIRQTPPPIRHKVYYDGGCPLCRREISFYQRQDTEARIEWIDAASCLDNDLGDNLTRTQALTRLYARRPSGQLLSGAAAFVTIWQQLPRWSRWGHWLDRHAMIRILDLAYAVFLRLRRVWRPSTVMHCAADGQCRIPATQRTQRK